jgi:hypothetical protein
MTTYLAILRSMTPTTTYQIVRVQSMRTGCPIVAAYPTTLSVKVQEIARLGTVDARSTTEALQTFHKKRATECKA